MLSLSTITPVGFTNGNTFTTAGTSTSLSSPFLATTVTFLSPGVVVSTGSLYSKVVPSGYCSGLILSLASGCGLAGSSNTYCVSGLTTTTLAGTSTKVSPSNFATTTTSFSPAVVVSTGSLYSKVVPSGYSSGVILDLASGCGLDLSATTNCGVLSTTRTVAGTSTSTLSPCLTTTVTFLSPGVVVSTSSLYSYVASSG